MTVIKRQVQLTTPILQAGNLRRELAQVVEKTTLEIATDVKRRMQEPKTGRTYARGAITKRASKVTRGLGLRERTTKAGNARAIAGYNFHRASAQGEAPAVDMGVLINSVRSKTKDLRGTVSSGVAYAARLEYKQNRPAFEPALEAARAGFERSVDDVVDRLCRG